MKTKNILFLIALLWGALITGQTAFDTSAVAAMNVLVFDTNGSGGGGIDFEPLSELKKVAGETDNKHDC